MAKQSNNFEGGTNGATISIANSSAGGQNGFAYVGIGSGSALTYSNTRAHSGSISARVAPSSGQNAYIQYGGSTNNLTSNDTAVTFWMYRTVNPSSEFTVLSATDTGGTRVAQINLQGDGRLRMRIEGATWPWTSSAPLPLNTWVRVRFFTRNQGSGTSHAKIAIFNGASLIEDFSTNTAVRTLTIAGVGVGKTGTDVSTEVFWIDDFAVESAATDYIDESEPVVNGFTTKGAVINAAGSTGDIASWSIVQQSGPSAAATNLAAGIWIVPIPTGSDAVWRVTITANDSRTAFEDFTVTASTENNTPVTVLIRDAGVWV